MRNRLLMCVLVLTLAALPLAAQNTDIESLAGLQFSFGNPGARALGMGGAFLGLADDASAAEANPAGLTILRKPEVTVEGRNYMTRQILNVSGTFPDIESEGFNSYSRRAETTFASVVLPAGNFAFAAYYHQPIMHEAELDPYGLFSTNPFEPQPDPVQFYLPSGDPPGSATPVSREQCIALNQANPNSCLQYESLQYASGTEVKMATLGVAAAYRIGTLSLGAAARYQTLKESAVTFRAFGGELTSANLQVTMNDDGDIEEENDLTYSAGFKWQAAQNFSVGGVYKKGPSFDAPVFLYDAASDNFFAQDVVFHAPDIYGVGISYRPIQPLTVNIDAVRVTYSNLVDDMRPANLAISVLETPYEAEDITELRAGAEYFFSTRIPFALRVGYWKEPAHAMKYVGPMTCTDTAIPVDQRPLCAAIRVNQGILFPGGEDQTHKSIGIGVAWPSFQIDAAYDTSDTFKVGSLSAVFRF